MYRFLLTPRWLALAVVAVLLAGTCVQLGLWQFSRQSERSAENATTAANLDADPVPVETLTTVDGTVDDGDEWREVTVTGTYDASEQLLVRYQSNAGRSGVDVVVPLVRADGTAVLVDRGFYESPGTTPDADAVPPPPAGEVTVTGWLRQDSAAGSEATAPAEGSVRAVSAAAVAPESSHPLLGGWVQARAESPAADASLAGPEPPDLGAGPHFFYGLQWWFFGLLGLLGYGWFAWDEAHPSRRRRGRSRTDDTDGATRQPSPEPAPSSDAR